MIYRITLKSVGCVPDDDMRSNAAHAVASGYPEIVPRDPHGRPLAVVGGGPSITEHMDELRNWPGDIWGINGACRWLIKQDITATLFSVDPDPVLADLIDDSVQSAILGVICHPTAFDKLGGRARFFHTGHIPALLTFTGGTTSATRVPGPAIALGYRSISYFGCEGNFAATTHSFKDEAPERQLLITAGGEHYRTTLQFMDQTQSLAEIIRSYPDMLHDRSGGLLSAMLAYPDTWEIVGLSAKLKQELDPEDNPVPLNLKGNAT